MTQPPDNNLHDWLDETVGETPDPIEGTQQVMSQIEETSQVGRWLPFPVFHRKVKVKTPTATDTAEYQPSPIPALNGHTPTVTGRTTSMLSPVKAITAGALIFAIGGVMLIAQPFQQQGTVPGAEAEAIAPRWVTGDIRASGSCSGGDIVWDGDIGRSRNAQCNPQGWTSSDPRLTGDVTRRWNADIYQTDEDALWVSMGVAYLRNDDGGWACSSSDLLRGIRTTVAGSTVEEEMVNGGTTTFDCVGDGGYEGLSALLVSELTAGFNEKFSGLVFSGDFPPLPEAPAAE
jgi:hypothetical protein